MENGLNKLFNLQLQTIDVYDQAVLILKYLGLHDEQGKKINISDLLTKTQRRSGHFLSFMMTVHSYQADPKSKHIRMTCRECVQLPLDLYAIGPFIDTQTMKAPHDLILHLEALYYGIKPYIFTFKKKRGDIF